MIKVNEFLSAAELFAECLHEVSGPCFQWKWPGHPVVVIALSSPNSGSMETTRAQQWLAHLSTFGQVIMVVIPAGIATGHMMMTAFLDQMIATTRSKISELKPIFQEGL
jgi:hypothetical protein